MNNYKTSYYKWIFVCGKCGVGKTTIACSIACFLAKQNLNTLIVGFGPTGNISALLDTSLCSDPRKILSVPNLWAMEYSLSDYMTFGSCEISILTTLLVDVEVNDYDIIVFDTESIQTILQFLEITLSSEKFIKNTKFRLFLDQIFDLFNDDMISDDLILKAIRRIKNPNDTLFISLLIPDYWPLLDTERFVQYLIEKGLRSNHILINNILPEISCFLHKDQQKKQLEYIRNIHHLYSNYKIFEIQHLDDELRNINGLIQMGDRFHDIFADLLSNFNENSIP